MTYHHITTKCTIFECSREVLLISTFLRNWTLLGSRFQLINSNGPLISDGENTIYIDIENSNWTFPDFNIILQIFQLVSTLWKCFSSSLMLRGTKLECLSQASLFSLVQYLRVWPGGIHSEVKPCSTWVRSGSICKYFTRVKGTNIHILLSKFLHCYT